MDKRIEELVKEAKSRLAEYGAEVMTLIQNGELDKLPELTDKSVLHILSAMEKLGYRKPEIVRRRAVFKTAYADELDDEPPDSLAGLLTPAGIITARHKGINRYLKAVEAEPENKELLGQDFISIAIAEAQLAECNERPDRPDREKIIQPPTNPYQEEGTELQAKAFVEGWEALLKAVEK